MRSARSAAPPHVRESPLAAWWRKRGFRDLGFALAVAALLVLAVFYRGALVELESLRGRMQGLEEQVSLLQEQNVDLQNETIRLQSELDTRANQLASIVGAQHTIILGGTDAAPTASGRLYVHDTTGTVVLNNLTALDENQIYQLWLIPPDGAPIPAGLLGHAGAGTETITLTLPTTLESIAAVGISVEPPGGSEAPTGPIVLLGERA
jgi:anti-sigma-K factor RskA